MSHLYESIKFLCCSRKQLHIKWKFCVAKSAHVWGKPAICMWSVMFDDCYYLSCGFLNITACPPKRHLLVSLSNWSPIWGFYFITWPNGRSRFLISHLKGYLSFHDWNFVCILSTKPWKHNNYSSVLPPNVLRMQKKICYSWCMILVSFRFIISLYSTRNLCKAVCSFNASWVRKMIYFCLPDFSKIIIIFFWWTHFVPAS